MHTRTHGRTGQKQYASGQTTLGRGIKSTVIPEPPATPISIYFLALSQTPDYTARQWIWSQSIVWHACLLHSFDGTHCTYPWRDGQAELTRVACHTLKWCTRRQTVIHLSTNRARRRVKSLIETKRGTTKPNRHHNNIQRH